MIPLRIMPEDIAHGIAFLTSDYARAITAVNLDINGGVTVGG